MEGIKNEKDELYKAAVTTFHTLLQKDPLILNDPSLTSFNETPLHIASSLGHLAFARALLAKKPKLVFELDSLAHLPSSEGHVEMVKLLLAVDLEACLLADRGGRIPLHLAAIRGHVGVLRELIRARPDSGLVPLNGDNVVHLCVKYCRLEALKELLQNDCEHRLLYSKDIDGNNVLHLAVMLNHLKVVKYLKSVTGIKENANALNRDGCTALDVFDKSQSKGFDSFRIQQVLVGIGVCRAKDLTGNIPTQPLPCPKMSCWSMFQKMTRDWIWHDDWIRLTNVSEQKKIN